MKALQPLPATAQASGLPESAVTATLRMFASFQRSLDAPAEPH
ncbi:MAG: hypothetical protein ACK5GZ_01650 [Cyanobium sp.]